MKNKIGGNMENAKKYVMLKAEQKGDKNERFTEADTEYYGRIPPDKRRGFVLLY